MKIEFKTEVRSENVQANLYHLCGPNETFQIDSCIVNWQIQPVLKQWGIWSFAQTVKSVVFIYSNVDDVSLLETNTETLTIKDTDGYNIDFEIKEYDGKRDFTINSIEFDPVTKYIKAII